MCADERVYLNNRIVACLIKIVVECKFMMAASEHFPFTWSKCSKEEQDGMRIGSSYYKYLELIS